MLGGLGRSLGIGGRQPGSCRGDFQLTAGCAREASPAKNWTVQRAGMKPGCLDWCYFAMRLLGWACAFWGASLFVTSHEASPSRSRRSFAGAVHTWHCPFRASVLVQTMAKHRRFKRGQTTAPEAFAWSHQTGVTPFPAPCSIAARHQTPTDGGASFLLLFLSFFVL